MTVLVEARRPGAALAVVLPNDDEAMRRLYELARIVRDAEWTARPVTGRDALRSALPEERNTSG